MQFLTSLAVPLLAFASNTTASYSFNATYGTIKTTVVSDSVVRATMNHPPLNLLDQKLATDLYDLLLDVNKTEDIKVLILDSAVPDYFIAHIDVHLLDAADPPPSNVDPVEIVGYFVTITRLLSTLPFVTIAEVNGRAHGPGSEIALQADMRFAGPNALFSQFENTLGIFPAAGAVPFLVKLIGRARTFEYVMAAKGVDAWLAEKIGWVNTAYPTASKLKEEVNALAKRIALFPKQSLVATKRSINYDRPSEDDLNTDVATINELRVTAIAEDLMTRFLKLTGNETRNRFELGMPDDLSLLYE